MAQAIQQVGIRFVEAWNAHDMQALGELFCADADFVNVLGRWSMGRQQIQAQHQKVHDTVFRQSCLSATEMRVKSLGDRTACLHVQWVLENILAPDGAPVPSRRGILTLILVAVERDWRIAVGQNTDIVAGG